MRRVVRGQRLAFVATTCPDGSPNVSPKGTIDVFDDDHLVFLDIRSPRTIANLARDPRVEVNVVDPLVRKGYRFRGTGRVLAEGPEFEAVLAHYQRQWGRDRRRVEHVVLVRVERASPLVSPAYDEGATEDELRARWRKRLLGDA
jgi:predicted pyridoxine 5'-phosphate oxidase superfamily flavin-nucleotide-binding protein